MAQFVITQNPGSRRRDPSGRFEKPKVPRVRLGSATAETLGRDRITKADGAGLAMADIPAKIEAALETNPDYPRLSPPLAPVPYRGGSGCAIVVGIE